MCRMISQNGEIDLITDLFPELENVKQLQFSVEQKTLVNANAFQSADVIVRHKERLLLGEMEWGVHPIFETDKTAFHRRRLSMVNARQEKLLDPDSFWHNQGLVKNPVLIPATRIYEHRHIDTWSSHVPYAINTNHQPEEEYFYIPGIYQVYETIQPNGQRIKVSGFAMITTEANQTMRYIHNHGENKHRMPLFVPLEMAKQWVSPTRTFGDFKAIINYRLPAEDLSYYTVHTLTGRQQRPDGKLKDAAWTWPGLPPLGNDQPIDISKVFITNLQKAG
ncbi:SOS response-associated peptidase family protein [Chitinophaga rhizophila]|uniref:Abasic site processing protein n=1 Tax=Chitinophaga rhizophila TaxID=2866212 RepID=A0ABS7G5Z8_9BACT|nr:SOS response-associated peptidase family protein [Chitinophaga rhizophila]MBW8683047.1 SOS response-associated peptidase [Chitinophaga rhizophila]